MGNQSFYNGDFDGAVDTQSIFQLIDQNGDDQIELEKLIRLLAKEGVLIDDPRLQQYLQENHEREPSGLWRGLISQEAFHNCILQYTFMKNALTNNFVIPDFNTFCQEIEKIFLKVREKTGGKVADYIPQLARVDPEQFAVSICTVDGQRFSIGDAHTKFCLQSTCKPINYCLAIEEHGENTVHRHIGREPSGRSFNELTLNLEGLPHNPLINAGAIMAAYLLKRDLDAADRFDHVFKAWEQLCAGRPMSFNNAVYLSERETADRNFALAYFMRENGAFPKDTHLLETLEFYFQCCSLESTTHDLAIAAATLANSGINPLTGHQIFHEKTVQDCLSLMLSCGMYDFSGEFAFRIGLPAKSGVSGAMLVVVPNLMGISIWSPRLDKLGNSVRGVAFCEGLVKSYNFHMYDTLIKETNKKNPRRRRYENEVSRTMLLIYAATNGDLDEVKRLGALGANLAAADYDGRTALHLAAAEGHEEIVAFLLDQGIAHDPVDRWGGKPIDDARRSGHDTVVRLLEQPVST